MSAAELIGRIRITQVVEALGGRTRHRRCQAFWRKGDGWNVALNDDKATWFDHARGEGGGALDLVQLIRSCTRTEALRWLADFAGVVLDDKPSTPAERAAFGRRRGAAELEARQLVEWREALVRALRETHTRHFRMFHELKAWIICNSLYSSLADVMAELCEIYERAYLRLEREIDCLVSAPFSLLLPIFRKQKREQAV